MPSQDTQTDCRAPSRPSGSCDVSDCHLNPGDDGVVSRYARRNHDRSPLPASPDSSPRAANSVSSTALFAAYRSTVLDPYPTDDVLRTGHRNLTKPILRSQERRNRRRL